MPADAVRRGRADPVRRVANRARIRGGWLADESIHGAVWLVASVAEQLEDEGEAFGGAKGEPEDEEMRCATGVIQTGVVVDRLI